MTKQTLLLLLVLIGVIGCAAYSGMGLHNGGILFVAKLIVVGDEVVVRKEHADAPVRFTDQNGAELKSNKLRIGDKILVSDQHFGQTFTITAIVPGKVTFRLEEAWAFPTGKKGRSKSIVEVTPYSNIEHNR